jgi:hypothetical protein
MIRHEIKDEKINWYFNKIKNRDFMKKYKNFHMNNFGKIKEEFGEIIKYKDLVYNLNYCLNFNQKMDKLNNMKINNKLIKSMKKYFI